MQARPNYKSKYVDLTCELCSEEEDRTEHLFRCKKLKSLNKKEFTVKDLENSNRETARFIMDVMALRKIGEGKGAAGVNYS